MSGESLSFSDADLAAAAAAYDPSLHEAPLCIGHPQHDAPAWGWVGQLQFADGALIATPRQLDPEFAELVRAGRYKKVSAAFYRPDSPSNPKPGAYYLRHVGFLGAQPPAVKGLRPVAFSDNAAELVVFGDWTDRATIGLLRRLRDFLLARFGQDEADRALPSDLLDQLAADAAQPEDCEDDMTATAYADRERQLAERERALNAKETTVADREKGVGSKEALFAEDEKKRRGDANTAQIELLVKQGRVLPSWRTWVAAFLERLEGSGAIAFGEGRERAEIDPAEAFRQFLAQLPQQVSFAEAARTPTERAGSHFAPPMQLPPGFRVDPDELELRDRAIVYAEEHKVDFLEAVRRLEGSAAF